MKNRIHRNALAILLCVLTLLLAACGSENSEENATVNEDVQLSNIRFSDMNLTEEENRMMQDIQTLLQNAKYICTEERYGPDTLKIENTTSYTLDIRFIVNAYDEEGALVEWGSVSVEDWKPGERIASKIIYNTASVNMERVEIMAEYINGSSYYRTEFLPLTVTRPEISQDENDKPVTVSVKGGLPQTINIKGWNGVTAYEITSFELQEEYSDGEYALVLIATKKMGKPNGFESINFRLVREDGVVADSGSFYFSYIKNGDTVRASENYVELAPGNYTIEFSS